MAENMTRQEKKTKETIYQYLRTQGYVSYAKIFSKFDLNFYIPPNGDVFIAAMLPGQYRILVNPMITDRKAMSTFIRHEILHQYFDHETRALKKLASRTGLDYDKLDDLSINELKEKLYSNDLFNYAGDYEISNRGYTDADKEIVRHAGEFLGLADTIKGLVTEDDHPDWVKLPMDEMYDKLLDLQEKIEEFIKNNMDEDTIPGILVGGGSSFYSSQTNTVYIGY